MTKIPNIQTASNKAVTKLKSVFPNHVNRISELGHDCFRYLYYSRAAWENSAPPSDYLQGVFETGKILEDIVVRIYNEKIGPETEPPTRIVGTQTEVKRDKLLDEYQISGTTDGFLQVYTDGKWVTVSVLDIKTCSQNTYPNFNCLEDMDRYTWSKKYKGQLTLYALGSNMEHCSVLFVNKGNIYQQKIVDFPLNLAFAEELLQKADFINKCIRENSPPERINRPDLCENCRFNAVCLPDLTVGEQIKRLNDPVVKELLDKVTELKDVKSEYERANRELNRMLIKGQDVVIPPYVITWTSDKNGRWTKKIKT